MVYRIYSSYSLYRINSSGIVSSSECSQLFLPIMSPLQVILVLRCPDHIKAVIAAGSHLFPSRTEKLSPLAPMVLHTRGRVGSRHFSEEALAEQSAWAFFVKGRAAYSPTGEWASGTATTECRCRSRRGAALGLCKAVASKAAAEAAKCKGGVAATFQGSPELSNESRGFLRHEK